MSKKISAKALASLYPSSRWKTRSVINSATSKVQKAYDEEFARLKSIQQTYQSIATFAGHASDAYGSFRNAKLAGYDGNLKNYAMLGADVQGKYQDDYKQLNKKVMDETNNKATLNDLYKSTTEHYKKGKLDRFSKKMNEVEFETLMDGYKQSIKDAPLPTKPLPEIAEDEFTLDENAFREDDDYEGKFSGLYDETELEAIADDKDANDKYWSRMQKFANNENYNFDFENDEDKLEWMDKLGKLSPEERFKVNRDIENSEFREQRREDRANLPGAEGEYEENFDRMYDVIEKTRKAQK